MSERVYRERATRRRWRTARPVLAVLTLAFAACAEDTADFGDPTEGGGGGGALSATTPTGGIPAADLGPPLTGDAASGPGPGPSSDASLEEKCGLVPELPYVCADGAAPCQCVENGDGTAQWRCGDCPAVDCNRNPADAACQKDAACITCHGLQGQAAQGGIENAHPWSYLGCVECHGGVGVDPANPVRMLTKEEAHVHIPAEIAEAGSATTPTETAYRNRYLGRAGVETLAGGLEWIRFMNPGDLRIVESTCAKAGCHEGAGEKVRRSTMSTLVGKYDAMLQAVGVPRHPDIAPLLGDDSVGKHLATYGAVDVQDPQWSRDTAPAGSVPGVRALVTRDREEIGFGLYTEEDILKETMNKLCGNCHLNNNGANDKFGTFRSAGCSACHMPYDFSGRSQSGDPMIPKTEPSYPDAYTSIRYPERPHPVRHQIQRIMTANDCLACHTGSARVVFQYQGIRTDDNRDLTRARNAGSTVDFRYSNLVDNARDPAARLHGFSQDQLIEYEDLDEDGEDDTPADVHHTAGLECIDCHTASEMHGDGRIYSRQNQATKIRCVHCHGNLEYPADPDNPNNVANELYFATGKDTRKVLFKFDQAPGFGEAGYPQVKAPGVWMRTKSRQEWRYVPQVAWGVQWDAATRECIGDGRRLDPRTQGFVCNPKSSIAHGRWQGTNRAAGDFDDGVGPRPGVEVERGADGQSENVGFEFSHLGEPAAGPNVNHEAGLECSACHATWHNMRYGNHLGLVDTDGQQRRYDWDRVTGEITIGAQGWFDFTFVDMLDLQLGIDARGKIAQFIPARLKVFVRQTVLDGQGQGRELMSQLGDPEHVWKTYRDRTGFGNLLQNAAPGVTDAPGFSAVCLEQAGYCDEDPRKNTNGALGVDQMESHAIQRRARDCQACHLGPNGAGADKVSAVFGFNPRGYTPQTSAYLRQIRSIQTNHGNYDTQRGMVIADDGIDHRLDYIVDEATGYPFVFTLHTRTDEGRGYQTYDPDSAGPINKQLIDKLKRVQVRNLDPQ
ncbi:hypothetical protein L6V77_18105 [Myxococcota bacterium]|nr:hypothetical protein [Myxococcota bacterium]